MRKHVIVTWPKSRPLQSYLDELAKADEDEKHINFRVSAKPDVHMGDRCYMVYDGAIRGFNEVVMVIRRRHGEVIDPISRQPMAAGWYIVRHPLWFPLAEAVPMKGFQGFRYTQARYPYTVPNRLEAADVGTQDRR